MTVAVDRLIHYAGWADKYEHLLGSVNPVASPHFNFTVTEPMGVVGVIAPDSPPLLGLLSMVAPVIASGNTVVALASEKVPYPAILLGEMLATSDLPGGVVNILTGFRRELVPTFATHAHIRAIYAAADGDDRKALRLGAAESVKRVRFVDRAPDWFSESAGGLDAIRDFVELKTIWHPIGRSGGPPPAGPPPIPPAGPLVQRLPQRGVSATSVGQWTFPRTFPFPRATWPGATGPR
jgi:aldehyde dehydrogenase (NAD+)